MGLVAPWHVGPSWTRTQTRVPCIGRQVLNHCATREVPGHLFLITCKYLYFPVEYCFLCSKKLFSSVFLLFCLFPNVVSCCFLAIYFITAENVAPKIFSSVFVEIFDQFFNFIFLQIIHHFQKQLLNPKSYNLFLSALCLFYFSRLQNRLLSLSRGV